MSTQADIRHTLRARRALTAAAVVSASCLVGLGLIEATTRLVFPAFDPSGRFEFAHQVGSLALGRPDTQAR